MKKIKWRRICVITSPRPLASVLPLSNLAEILSRITDFCYVITGNDGGKILTLNVNIKGYSIMYKPKPHILTRILSYIVLQIKIIYLIFKVNKQIDVFIIFMGEGLLFPVLFCKLLKKPLLLVLASSAERISEKDRDSLSKLFVFMENANYRLADRIIIFSSKLLTQWGLEKYRDKIVIAQNHFLDFNKFKLSLRLGDRDNLVGYIGRLSEEKGIVNFVDAIPIIMKNGPEIKFLIGGDGKLKEHITTILNKNNLNKNVDLAGWVSHDNLPQYFSKLKLLVIPSYTEGLPNVMIEAMACGTPILANSVGAITDLIKDCETGFIMENNSPDGIALNVLRALNHPDLERIANNGKALVERKFTIENATQNFKEILNIL